VWAKIKVFTCFVLNLPPAKKRALVKYIFKSGLNPLINLLKDWMLGILLAE
jgi:hypothetical protein